MDSLLLVASVGWPRVIASLRWPTTVAAVGLNLAVATAAIRSSHAVAATGLSTCHPNVVGSRAMTTSRCSLAIAAIGWSPGIATYGRSSDLTTAIGWSLAMANDLLSTGIAATSIRCSLAVLFIARADEGKDSQADS